jgi:hypothetical protein
MHQLTRDQAAAIQDLTVIESFDSKTGKLTSRRYRYRLQDKQAALVNLGKHLGLFGPDFSVNTAVVINQQASSLDEAMLERALIGVIEARQATDHVDIVALSSPPAATDAEPKLRLVPVPDQVVSPPSEDKLQTTTEAFYAWHNNRRDHLE